jgi:hypothetical protein
MIDQDMAHQDLGMVGRRFASPTRGSRWCLLLLVVGEEARVAAPSRTHEDAAVEAEDILSQADEALVMG